VSRRSRGAREARRIVVLNERDLANPRAGGAEIHVVEIFRRLAARGHSVRMLTASFRGAAHTSSNLGVVKGREGACR
jgi:hypothetical protein